ncbi:diflavin oxidoreductase [Flavisolibacter nicotianae]|uniref:diflavin oxidoreductase n=1 Tax=Flavisolibacter nicotianae TaxID=2364882 RepID=UPI000EB5B431|nr:flavodoxin domain-containing protein [Flavisolibacter nicotianae]
MIAQSKIKQVQEMVTGLTREEIIWLSGYLSGLAGAETALLPSESTATATPAAVQKITIAYGTETGNAKKLATSFAAKAKKKGIQSKLVSLDQYKLTDLPKEEWFFTVISTQGDGEPPATAKKFYDFVHQDNIKLSKLNYGVLALGDTAYPLFCKAGEDVDQQLQKLGGNRVAPLQKLDTDYEEAAEQWMVSLLNSLLSSAPATTPVTAPVAKKTGRKTYTGKIQANVNLNGRGSGKQTFHLEIAAEEVAFEPGDAAGITPLNKPELVQRIATLSGFEEETVVTYKDETIALGQLLQRKVSLVNLPERVVKAYAGIVKQDIPATRMDFLDLLRIYPVNGQEQFLAALQILDPIAPRLYSIASSPEAHSGEVHLTVGMHRFVANDQLKDGLASAFLSQLKEGDEVEFYIHKNHLFKLPAADKDVIMIGPGTGIAPFRSFVAHRDATGADGRNWLFFGDQHFTTDFLYQTEWLNWIETGVLTKMNVAFSRDQDEKLYVQHKLWQHREELVKWIENGAYLYICGAKEPMSNDVENMLTRIFREQKGVSDDTAVELLNALKEEGRYLKDVY